MKRSYDDRILVGDHSFWLDGWHMKMNKEEECFGHFAEEFIGEHHLLLRTSECFHQFWKLMIYYVFLKILNFNFKIESAVCMYLLTVKSVVDSCYIGWWESDSESELARKTASINQVRHYLSYVLSMKSSQITKSAPILKRKKKITYREDCW